MLTAGIRLGNYEIVAPLGAGGMGEVYAARDTRLDRAVAIKVLPADFAKDADRLKRFEQEARATSALNHPNILTVYDVGAHAGNPYLVMELLEGEELRAQIAAGAMAPRKAIEYAQQIASGLAAAHAKGIVHRDLKPENLFVTKDERVKILDFGLAKLRPPRNEQVGLEDETQKKITDPGTVMGTVGYMSPEQVRGQEADHRADIFSFGMILHEMLSGQRAFTGESMADVMSAILKDEPPELSESNAKISPQLEKIVRRCLEKKPERRFHSAHDLGFALEALATPSSSGANRTEAAQALETSATTKRGGWRDRIGWIAAGVMTLIAALALGVAYVPRSALDAEPMRLYLNPPEKATRFDWPTISPDGRMLAFVATVEGKTQLWVRPLNSTIAKPLGEAANAALPFWSPDNQYLGFFESGKLKKIALAGGTAVTLCDASFADGGTWNREGIILFSAGEGGIKRVSANGGSLANVTTVDRSHGETVHGNPVFLPDERHFLFGKLTSDPTKSGAYLGSLDGGEAKHLLPVDNRILGVTIHPAAKNEGYLVFVRQGALLAQSFDFAQGQLAGEPVQLAEQVQIPPGGMARFSLSTNGVLVLLGGGSKQQLTWVSRTGNKLGTIGTVGTYVTLRLSPDEKRVAFGFRDHQVTRTDIHLFDFERGTDQRFTFDPAFDQAPLWSPDGNRLVWTSFREGVPGLYQKAANGAGQEELLLKSAYEPVAGDWSADGRFILYNETNQQTGADLWVLPMEGERKPWPWLNTRFNERGGKFSPDGKWIAYYSDESGRSEIYVQAFVPGAPVAGGKWQISTNGGALPQWRRDGREMYYLAYGKLMAVDVTLGAEVKAGIPKELFSVSSIQANFTGYAKTGDGQRFLFVTSAEEASVPPFTVVLNWMAAVKN